jgi:hypothetical protein
MKSSIALNNTLDQTNWSFIHDIDSIDDIVYNFTNIIYNAMLLHIPNKTIKIRTKDKPWLNKDIKKLIRATHRLHKRQLRTRNLQHIEQFQDKRRETKQSIRLAKKNILQIHIYEITR